MKTRPGRKRAMQGGQSTVEFMLMVPVIFTMFFFIIEMSLYFTAIHYTNYTAFVTARSQMVNFGKGAASTSNANSNAEYIAGLLMTGRALRDNYSVNASGGVVQIAMQEWETHFPFLNRLMPDKKYRVTVGLGRNEFDYEADARERNNMNCGDNDVANVYCGY